jgi:hypothetical protein
MAGIVPKEMKNGALVGSNGGNCAMKIKRLKTITNRILFRNNLLIGCGTADGDSIY